MEENDKFKTRMNTEQGESKIEKESTNRSLTHEEAVKEITDKSNELLKMFDNEGQEDESIEILTF